MKREPPSAENKPRVRKSDKVAQLAYFVGHWKSSGTMRLGSTTYTFTSADGRSRHTIRIESSNSFRFKTEISLDGQSWSTLVDGTSTKQS